MSKLFIVLMVVSMFVGSAFAEQNGDATAASADTACQPETDNGTAQTGEGAGGATATPPTPPTSTQE